MKKLSVLFVLFFLTVGLGFFLSFQSIPNQEGYFEAAWQLSHGDFGKTLLSPSVTPLNFLVGYLLEKILQVSTNNAWKIMDLVFCGFLGVFLVHIYWKNQKPKTLNDFVVAPLTFLSSVGFIFYFTSTSGEGMPVFFAVTGLYFWHKRSFVRAVLLFILSFLSKYTLYLIAPGVGLWILFHIKSYTREELKKIAALGMLFLLVFLIYHTTKQWGDIKLQTDYISDFSFNVILKNFPHYFVASILSAPLVVLFSFSHPSITNLFWIAGLSSFFMLTRRYFYWNHPQQIVAFLMLYLFTHPYAKALLQKRYVFLQCVFSVSLLAGLTFFPTAVSFFPGHLTKQESLAIDREILKNYHGGKVGYYLNKRFDEPFPNYEISYMDPSWDFVVEDTEYVVVPRGLIPEQIVRHTHCRLIYYQTVGQNMIYQVKCEKRPI